MLTYTPWVKIINTLVAVIKLNTFLLEIYEYSILPQFGGRTEYYVIEKGKGEKKVSFDVEVTYYFNLFC